MASTGCIAVVTGASGGMGRATAALLASEHDRKVFLLARSPDKGRSAVDEVNKRSRRHDAELVVCDLASLASIKSAAADIASRCERIDVLVNNAGVITLKREITEDGFERQLGVNHLGHFLLAGSSVPVDAVHPGAVSTQIGVNRQTGFGALVHRLLRPFMQTPEQGSATAVYLASSSDAFWISGQAIEFRWPG